MTKLLHISQPCLLKQTLTVSEQTRSKKGTLLQEKIVQVLMTAICLLPRQQNKNVIFKKNESSSFSKTRRHISLPDDKNRGSNVPFKENILKRNFSHRHILNNTAEDLKRNFFRRTGRKKERKNKI
jgi:hypothetical protein